MKMTAVSNIITLVLIILLTGCASVPGSGFSLHSGADIYRTSLSSDVNGPSRSVFHEITEQTRLAKLATSNYRSRLLNNKYIEDYVSTSGYKAMFAIIPKSCSNKYRYYSSNNSNELAAIGRAQRGCNQGAAKINNLLGSDCECRIVALDNIFFYPENIYEEHVKWFPVHIEIIEDSNVIHVKGRAETSNSRTEGEFNVFNDSGVAVCSGEFNLRGGAKGSISIDCFNGKYIGSGEVVKAGYDRHLNMFYGSALIDSNTGVMRVVYGPDAVSK